VIAGFGDGSDTLGTQRYLIKYQGRIHFWGSNVDINAGQPFDLERWQMITFTFDGETLRIYKNGQEVKAQAAILADAEPIVKIAAIGPWGTVYPLSGSVAGFTIWDQAIPADYIHALARMTGSAANSPDGRDRQE